MMIYIKKIFLLISLNQFEVRNLLNSINGKNLLIYLKMSECINLSNIYSKINDRYKF